MSEEDKVFYGNYFEQYNERLMELFGPNESHSIVQPLEDATLRNTFYSLLENDIRYTSVVTLNPVFLKVFHFLLRNTPTRVGDALNNLLMQGPTWDSTEYPVKS